MPLGEFDIIERYFRPHRAPRADVVLGAGDDGAVVRAPEGMALVSAQATRTGVEGGGAQPDSFAHRALASALNRLAACGAQPRWATLALTLESNAEAWLAAFSSGFEALAARYQVALVGGDTTHGPLTVTVTADGVVPPGEALAPAGAKPGEALCVTGTVASAALELARGEDLPEAVRRQARERLDYPEPRVGAGRLLGRLATAAVDLGDGFERGVRRLLEASGTGASIDPACLPLEEALRRALADDRRTLAAIARACDHELAFSLPPERLRAAEKALASAGVAVTMIGRIEARPGLRWAGLGDRPAGG